MRVAGAPATSPARLVAPGEDVVVTGPPARYVSRGGEKLHAALARFALAVAERHALDAGASTGGFTDCLLQHGAASVVAVDVGYGQLHERLRVDGRVTSLERTNVRYLTAAELPSAAPFDLIVADLSFISLRAVLPVLLGTLAGPDADAVLLVKPQFEAGKAEADRGKGVIRDPAVWRRVLGEVASSIEAQGAVMMDVMRSPLLGADGNVEFLVHARAHASGPAPAVDLDSVVASVQDGE